MSSTLPPKPSCLRHESVAQVLCKTDRQFLCTQCLIDKEHSSGGCQLVELSKMKSRGDLLLVDLILLRHIAEGKLKDREGIEEAVEGEKQRVADEMEERCNVLKQKLDEMKNNSKAEMEADFDKQVVKAQKEKEALRKLADNLQGQIDKMTANGNEVHLAGPEFHKVYDKQHAARLTLGRVTDRDFACFGRFEIANNLREIETGKRKIFGKSTLLFRSFPRNGQKN